MRLIPLLISALILASPGLFATPVAVTFGTTDTGPTSSEHVMLLTPTPSGQVLTNLGIRVNNATITNTPPTPGVITTGDANGMPQDDPNGYYLKLFHDSYYNEDLAQTIPHDSYFDFVNPANGNERWATSQVGFTVYGGSNTSGVYITAKDINGNVVASRWIAPSNWDDPTPRPDIWVVLQSSTANIARVEFSQNWREYPILVSGGGFDEDGNPVGYSSLGEAAYKFRQQGGVYALTPIGIDNIRAHIVPEPSTFVLGAAALGGLILNRRRVMGRQS